MKYDFSYLFVYFKLYFVVLQSLLADYWSDFYFTVFVVNVYLSLQTSFGLCGHYTVSFCHFVINCLLIFRRNFL